MWEAAKSMTWPSARCAPWGGLLFSAASGSSFAGWSAVSRNSASVEPDRSPPGEPEDFAELFHRHQIDVSRVCRRMLRGILDDSAEEDASGEVFLRARRALASYDPERPFRPWLLGIAGNYCVDLLRRRAKELRLFDERDLSDGDLADPGPSPLRRLIRAEEQASLLEALDELSPKYRLPLVLRHFSELDYASIAEILGVTHGQVGSLLFRAKRQLRSRLSPANPGRASRR